MDEKRIKEKLEDPEFERQYIEATRRGKEYLEKAPKASSARYDAKSRRIVIDMTTGVTLMIPVSLIQGLQTDDEKALADFNLMADGTEIHWETLDAQFYIESFLKGVFGSQKWMSGLREHLAEIGRKGGSAKTSAKRAASAENGKKGGRPRTRRTA